MEWMRRMKWVEVGSWQRLSWFFEAFLWISEGMALMSADEAPDTQNDVMKNKAKLNPPPTWPKVSGIERVGFAVSFIAEYMPLFVHLQISVVLQHSNED